MKSKNLFQFNKKAKTNEKEEEWKEVGGEMRKREEGTIKEGRSKKPERISSEKKVGKKEESLREDVKEEGGRKEENKSNMEKKKEGASTNFLIRKDKRVLFVERIGVRHNDLDKSTKHDSKKVRIGYRKEGRRIVREDRKEARGRRRKKYKFNL